LVSPPSAGRSGGGRVGKPRISPVHSLGWSGWPAGGVEEEVARSDRRFVEAEIFSGGGALRSSAADLPPSPHSLLGGAALCFFPMPEAVERRLRWLEFVEEEVVLKQGDGDDGGARWRIFGSELRRLPVRQGAPSDPRLKWRSGGGAPAIRRARRRRHRGPQGLFCNFLFVLGLSVMNLALI
jgi:hypothetical protein